MKQYLDLVKHVLQNGEKKSDRTGTGTLSVFGAQSKYDLRDGFPLLTTKKILYDSVLRELLWFLSGSVYITELAKHTPIWDAWADDYGKVGPVYGAQWRSWPAKNPWYAIDQIENALHTIKTNPDSRRIIVSAWNVSQLDLMALPPCHLLFQFYVSQGQYLDCQLYQRSADIALGVPFNVASYATLMYMFGLECNLVPRFFIHTIGDAHIYTNHIEGLKEQLTREPKKLPVLTINKKPFDDLVFEDFKIENYTHHPFIKFKISV